MCLLKPVSSSFQDDFHARAAPMKHENGTRQLPTAEGFLGLPSISILPVGADNSGSFTQFLPRKFSMEKAQMES